MKKILSLVLVLALMLGMCCSCASPERKNDKILLVTSFYPIYIFTLNLVDGVTEFEVECMAEQNTGCLHDYQLLSRDARLIADADAFVINGAGMESFLEDVYSSNENLRLIDSSEGIELIEECSEHHNEEEKDEHHEHNHTVNSHIWVSPENAKLQVKNISDELVEIYPQYKEQIEINRDSYINRLDKLSDELKSAFKDIGGKNIITFHESYEYLAKEYSLNIVATVESHDGEEPSARELAELVDLINEKDVVALFTEPLYKGTVADILSNETGIKVYQLNPVLQGEKSFTAYEDIMRENMSVLKAVK